MSLEKKRKIEIEQAKKLAKLEIEKSLHLHFRFGRMFPMNLASK